MEDEWLTPLTVIVLTFAALGGLVLLRVLAISREQMIALYDRDRQAERGKMERQNRQQDRHHGDEETIVV